MALAHCMRRFRRPKPIAYCNGWHITPKHASWLNMVELDNLASFAVSVLTDVSATARN